MAGRMHESLMDLHNKYGTVVRVAPDELSFSSPMRGKRSTAVTGPGSGRRT